MAGRRRGFIRATDLPEADNIFQRFTLPDYNNINDAPKETALNFDPAWEHRHAKHEEAQAHQEEETTSGVTAEELEKICQSAIEEGKQAGFEQGLLEGKQAGYEQGKQEGIEKGRQEGIEKGRIEGHAQIEARCEQFDQLIEKIAHPLTQVTHDIQRQLLDLIIHLSNTVVNTEIKTNPQIILQSIQDAVSALPIDHRTVDLYLCPDDAYWVRQFYSEDTLNAKRWVLHDDLTLSRGDLRLLCGESQLDMSFKQRVDAAFERFLLQNMQNEGALLPDKVAVSEKTSHSVFESDSAKRSDNATSPRMENVTTDTPETELPLSSSLDQSEVSQPASNASLDISYDEALSLNEQTISASGVQSTDEEKHD